MPNLKSVRLFTWGVLKWMWPVILFAYADSEDLLKRVLPENVFLQNIARDVPLKYHAILWGAFLFFSSLKVYHDVRARIEDEENKRVKLLFLIGHEIYSGVKKVCYFLHVATEGAYNYDIISTKMNGSLTIQFYDLDMEGDLSQSIRRCYEMFDTINHNIRHEVGLKMIGENRATEMRRITVPGWCKTYIHEMIEAHIKIADGFDKIKSGHYSNKSIPRLTEKEKDAALENKKKLD